MANLLPNRILHTMLRVSNLERSLDFYCNRLGMQEFRRETYKSGGFTLSFVGYGTEETDAVLELTYNHDDRTYRTGDRFGHIALEVDDIEGVFRQLARQCVPIVREPEPMQHADQNGKRDIIAFVQDPDGNRIELIAATTS